MKDFKYNAQIYVLPSLLQVPHLLSSRSKRFRFPSHKTVASISQPQTCLQALPTYNKSIVKMNDIFLIKEKCKNVNYSNLWI